MRYQVGAVYGADATTPAWHNVESKKDRTSSDTVPGRVLLGNCCDIARAWIVLLYGHRKDVTYGDSGECCHTCAPMTHRMDAS